MTMFIAIDVETANRSRHSICQIGLVAFKNDAPLWRWETLVNPEEAFEKQNIKIHGIKPGNAAHGATFPKVLDTIRPIVENQVLVCHGTFDYEAIQQAAQKYGAEAPNCTWIDTCDLARTAWPDLESHRLDTLCLHLKIPLVHHDAGYDAVACGHVLIRATQEMGAEFSDLLEMSPIQHQTEYQPPAHPPQNAYASIAMKGRNAGPLTGQVLVCTGEMSLGKYKIAELAASLGCDVEDKFTQKRTTILVTGERDPLQFNGCIKSQKQIDAENAIAKGKQIQILSEQEFLTLASQLGAT